MVFERWSQREGSEEHMVLVTPEFHVAMAAVDADDRVNRGLRGVHYFIVSHLPDPSGDEHAHFRIMTATAAIETARRSWASPHEW